MLERQASDGGGTLSRKDFLRLAGAAGLGGAVLGPGGPLRPRSAAATQLPAPRLGPTDLSFTIKAQYRPFEIVARGFAAVDDGFDRDAGHYRRFAPGPVHDAGTAAEAGGALTVSGAPFVALFAAATRPVAPYAAVQGSPSRSPSTGSAPNSSGPAPT